MRKSIVLQCVAFLLAVGAAYVSYTLLQVHVNAKPPEWIDFGCTVKPDKGAANCKAVIQTRWGYFPPLKEDRSGYTKWTFPAAQLGWMYYSALAIWILGVGRPSYSRRWVHAILLLLVGLGLGASIYFISVMFLKLDQWCPWCIVTHVANFGIAVCVFLLWPRAPLTDPAPQTAARTPSVAIPYPTIRGLIATVIAMILVSTTENYMLGKAIQEGFAANTQQTLRQCMEGLNQLRGDPVRMMTMWEQAEPRTIALREDDPMKSGAKSNQLVWDLIIFSDFECPSCKRTAMFLDQQVLAMFDGGLRIVYKHFPANPACNSQIASAVHKNACLAAQISEAARLQGGPTAFWAAHDLLFSLQKDASGLDGLDPAKVATQLKLDPQRLIADLSSPAIAQRISEDAAEAVKAGIPSTPYLILQGKPINGLAAKEANFWDKLADRYWQQSGTARPDTTRPKPAVPTISPATPPPTGGK